MQKANLTGISLLACCNHTCSQGQPSRTQFICCVISQNADPRLRQELTSSDNLLQEQMEAQLQIATLSNGFDETAVCHTFALFSAAVR